MLNFMTLPNIIYMNRKYNNFFTIVFNYFQIPNTFRPLFFNGSLVENLVKKQVILENKKTIKKGSFATKNYKNISRA